MLTLRPTELRIEISYNSNNRNNNHVNANLRKSDDQTAEKHSGKEANILKEH